METGTIKLSSYGTATFSTDKAFIMPEGVIGRICTNFISTGDGNATILTPALYKSGDTVPARTPLIIEGKEGTYTYYITECSDEPPANNLLHGIFTEDEAVLATSNLYEILILSVFDNILNFYSLSTDENNPGYYIPLSVGKSYLAVPLWKNNAEYFKSAIGIQSDFTKIINNMKHYSDRQKWFHKLKWLLGRIKSCKCGNARHIGKLDVDGNESDFVKQLRVIFK